MSLSWSTCFKSLLLLAAMTLPCVLHAQTSDATSSPTPAPSGSSVTYCAGTCNGVPTHWKLFGQAHFERNPLCPGGFMIDQIGFGPSNYAVLTFTVPVAGTYDISAALETEYARALYIWLGSESGPLSTGSPFLITGKSFKVPVEWQLGSIELQAGTNKLVFGNPHTTGPTDRDPYISAVTITGPF
jgi:hypothetical protein